LAGKTPNEARDNFIAPIQRALSCLSTAVVSYRPAAVGDIEVLILSEDPVRVPLNSGATVYLSVDQQYRLVEAEGAPGPCKASSRGYRYQLEAEDGHEFAAWHWHPFGRSKERRPLLHVGDGPLVGTHLPSGRVGVEAVFRLLLGELDARPPRTDWEQVLDDVDEAYRTWRTWA
jgi:hypothetical protein